MADHEYENGRLCPEGDGGNSTITNQDEAEILARTTQTIAVRAEGMQEPGRH